MKKNFIYNFLLTSSNLLFPLLTFPYLSRILGSEGLGLCNFILSYGQNFMIIAALGLPVYGTREIAKLGNDKVLRSKLFFELLSIHLIFSCFLLAIYIVSIFLSPDFSNYKQLALIGGLLIIFNVFSIEWLFTGVNDFKYITIRSVLIRVLSISAIFLFVKKENDFIIFFVIIICTTFLTVLVDVYYARNFISGKIVLTVKGISTHLKPILVLGIYLVLTSVYSVMPTTFLGFLSTKSAVGYFYGANRIIRVIISIFAALITVMIPHLNQVLEQKGKEAYQLLVSKSLNVVISFGIPITFFVFLLAKPIVLILAGKKFINSILVIQIMSPVILVVAFAQVFVLLILNVYRKDRNMVWLSVIGMVISVLINLIFIPHFAERATAVSQLAAELLVTMIAFFLAKKVLDFSFPTKVLLLNLLLVLPFALISYLSFKLLQNEFLILLLSGLLCGLYFLYYQLYILKNQLLKDFVMSFFYKFKGNHSYNK